MYTKKAVRAAFARLCAVIAAAAALCGCEYSSAMEFDEGEEIGVISREAGSGTRAAFVSAFDIERTGDNDRRLDATTARAVVTNSTAVMLRTVASDRYAIGYGSLAVLGDDVRVVSIDSVLPCESTVKDGSYRAVRYLDIVTAGEVSRAAQGFIDYILSTDGQRTVVEMGFFSCGSPAVSEPCRDTSGKIVAAGSSSVVPVIERLAEQYSALVPGVRIEVQQSDSSTGIAGAVEGLFDIGLSSRELTDSEKALGAVSTPIAADAIAVIVNPANPIRELSARQVMEIFSGELSMWSELEASY